MNFSPWLEFVAVLAGAIFGSYLAVRVELATIKEQMKAQGEKLSEQIKGHSVRIEDHARRIERLEGEYFKG